MRTNLFEALLARAFMSVAREYNVPVPAVIEWITNNVPPGIHPASKGPEFVEMFRADCQAGKVPTVTLDEGT